VRREPKRASDRADRPGGNGRPEAAETDLLTPTDPQRQRPKLRLHTLSGEVSGSNPLALLSWQPKKADEIWTRAEWTSLSEHLHNDTPPFHYVMGFSRDGETHYKRAKSVPASRAISWSWTSIVGTSKRKLAFVPYSANDHQLSRWGGLDFDAHDGNVDRARELSGCGAVGGDVWARAGKRVPVIALTLTPHRTAASS
jgi:hypothetical protein